MRRNQTLLLLLAAGMLLGVTGCTPERPREDPAVGEPLPDTIPAATTGADLPEGMLLPPVADDTTPPPPR